MTTISDRSPLPIFAFIIFSMAATRRIGELRRQEGPFHSMLTSQGLHDCGFTLRISAFLEFLTPIVLLAKAEYFARLPVRQRRLEA